MSFIGARIFANRFVLKEKLSSGSFGVVYLVHDRATNNDCALKVEKEENIETKTLEREISIMTLLDQIIGVPQIIWHGQEGNMQMLAMELLGKDLSYYFRQYKRFSLKCCLQVAYDCVEILKKIHKRFVIHRDLKPENIMMSKELDQMYIVDFGISKIYFEAEHIPFKEDKDFLGTTRYASIAAHKGQELGRKDDLESLFYIIIYFLKGKLPWQNLPVDENERNRLVGELKQTIPLNELIGKKLPELIEILKYIRQLKFQEQPDYDYIQNQIIKTAENNNIQLDGYYDWTEGMKFSKKLTKSKSLEKKEYQSPRIQMKSTTKISNQVIWSISDNYNPQSQKNLLVPPEKYKRTDGKHLTSSSNNSLIVASNTSMRLKYLPSVVNKKTVTLKKMVSIEIVMNDESQFNEYMDENFDEEPLIYKYSNANKQNGISFKEMNLFQQLHKQSK